MKKIEPIIRLFTVLLAVLFVFSSCDNNDDSDGKKGLAVESINKTNVENYVGTLEPVEIAYLENMYYIKGSGLSTLTKVTYNDVEISFNATMVTDGGVFLTIPSTVLYNNKVINNSFKLYTGLGTLVYKFPIANPDPQILNAEKAVPDAGDILTIKAYKPISVKISGVQAEIVGIPTSTQIQVKVPQSFQGSGDLIVLSDYGLSNPLSLGIDYLIYADDFSGSATPVGSGHWGGSEDFASTEIVSRGTHSIKRETGGWSLAWIDYTPVDVKGYIYLKISVRPDVVRNLRFSINSEEGLDENTASGDKHGIEVQLEPGKWNHISIPVKDLIDLDKPNTTVKRLYIRDLNGSAANIFLDDIGFI
ncbi:hypothetical protein [Flavobacterium aquicola]|uniref:Uncharacterized protein n=1 Tax=Flavobacterium aquicola TaxID=1682742 RepID=A0A3E0EVM1_9FLAO|nr:hypothetical protein [Flavobacterium aquicola]REH01177.1 hypothetical protein C8P67_102441 [Flavobacterium aquicola]